ncbi:helix-turn-helix transcriptional regulator [Sphingosinicella soli]|uniref:DNA-binding CsgD family transcriptional regulator n=1 Tax=Sphingosinicella soli TaxID=333708 RepID=A0A7W7F6G0_9SPHN|nr:LuxR C-terminal-related transcriptional regulator [Sphingosinicella soli]MBB4632316.1 DNA-binding CsgD family transcriptional regulator [Sphingosinicella soli]
MAECPPLLDPDVGAALVETAGTPVFGLLMLNAAQRVAGVDEIFAYHVQDGQRPVALSSISERGDHDLRARHYAERFYHHDPVVHARRRTAAGRGFVACVRAGEIGLRDYRAICFEQPRFADKLCFGWRGAGRAIVLSFYRRDGGVGMQGDSDGTAALAALANVGLTALARQTIAAPSPEGRIVERLEARLARTFPSLTLRERQVAARTIAGWTAERTADALAIRRSSVLTYRQRAYQRLGFSGASDFLPAILD